jgi:hypothetical protein
MVAYVIPALAPLGLGPPSRTGSDFLTGWANCGSPCMGLFLTSFSFNIIYLLNLLKIIKIKNVNLFFELIFV